MVDLSDRRSFVPPNFPTLKIDFMFSETFLQTLVYVALGWTALGAVVLVALLITDWIRGTLW